MPEINLDEFNSATRVYIAPGIVDNYFKGGPNMRYLKEKRLKIFPGGTQIQETFMFRPMKGGSYVRGGTPFNTTRAQTRAGLRFNLRLYYVNITEYLEDIEIELATPEAAFSTVKADMADAALTLSAIQEIALMHHGSDQTGAGGTNRLGEISGWPEALNNGSTPSWEGFTHPVYGEQNRLAADLGPALLPAGSAANSTVPAAVNGPPNNRFLKHSYLSCQVGDEHPVLGVTTRHCMGLIAEQQMPLQKMEDTIEPRIGIAGIKYEQATIVTSDYMPGTLGENNVDIGNYLSTTGETFLWLNPGGEGEDAYFRMWFPKSRKFQYGFTGFKPRFDGTQLSGQTLVACQLTVRAIRLQRLMHNIRQTST
jgi:hypothetical protein